MKCDSGIKADRKRCALYFESSAGLATALNVFIGYEKAASVVKESRMTGKSIKETAIDKGVMTEAGWRTLMKPRNITAPVDLKGLIRKGTPKK